MRDEERRSLLRILDANLNRAAEALRAAEDVCRFHWSLAGFARDLKEVRHAVLGAVDGPGRRGDRLEGRDVEGDAGRGNPSPSGPVNPGEMAFRNLERAREAIRTLEETCRTLIPEAAPLLEKARYDLYAAEKGIARLDAGPSSLASRLAASRLCLLATASLSARPLEEAVEAALDGGADVIQLREKGAPDREVLRLALSLREATARRGALFIVNDRPDLAILSSADGVHLGQDDLPLAAARRILGEGRLIGISTHSLAQARDAERRGADYIGLGPIFPTRTKDAGPLLGPGGLREALAAVSIPAFAIGGIDADRIPAIREAGATRVAVSRAILAAPDPAVAARRIRKAMEAE